MEFERNELNKNSFGGTERMMDQLYKDLPEELLKEYQIIPSRVRELDDKKLRVLYLHDLAEDPEAKAAVEDNGSFTRFNRIVFVSHWQRNQFFCKYPDLKSNWSRTAVIQNSIIPIEKHDKPKGKINIIYHTTPHRGLNILYAAVNKLAEKHPEIHLNVYSSFELYGWKERDAEYEGLFNDIKNHANMTYHGFKPNDEVREALKQAHIFAYPSIWPETSCIALIEAMSAGCICVHPDYAALPETASNWTMMYNWNEDINAHAQQFLNALDVAIDVAKQNQESESFYSNQLNSQKAFVDMFNNWEIKKKHWEAFLMSFKNEDREIKNQYKCFRYTA